MIQARLNDAAIALCDLLESAGIKHGIFGGFAIGTLGGPRESKDIDCLAAISKPEIVALLDGTDGFTVLSQARTDYVAFLWSEKADRSQAVLVEIFVEDFKGSHHKMTQIHPQTHHVTGQLSPSPRPISLLPPHLIFKGKIFAAARRAKFHDSADLRWLQNNYSTQIQEYAQAFPLEEVGLAMRRYGILVRMFERFGVDVERAEKGVRGCSLRELPSYRRGDVQGSLMTPERVQRVLHL